ncbi:Fam227b [Phodopus roborovskii]|uniref:Fam227b protein n=1 Tax=Phodopus roborovskii TaxID=109678 RepID=A0AAU9Z7A8_PHORO|nr:Fam227b [Phodopus roborovskii]
MQKPAPQRAQEPPKNFEEFLKAQNWDCWPRDVRFRDSDIWEDALKKLEEDASFASIYSYLWTNVPRIFETVSTMESRLKECSLLLQKHSSNLFECNRMISKKSSHPNLERYKAFLKEHCRRRKIMLSDEMETEKNIEGCNFSGYKPSELTQLPRHLDAKQIYLFVLRNNNFEEKLFKVWRTHILSDSSIALLHDCFWWWFLHKFKPDKRDQDCLFDRISESYVTLFMRIPHKKKDAFFQVYPDFLAQAIYAAFQESFPESSNLFNNEFKEDLGNTIFLWLSGLKPQAGFWTHWRLKELCTTTIHGSRRAPLKSVKKRLISSQERIAANLPKIIKIPLHLHYPEVNTFLFSLILLFPTFCQVSIQEKINLFKKFFKNGVHMGSSERIKVGNHILFLLLSQIIIKLKSNKTMRSLKIKVRGMLSDLDCGNSCWPSLGEHAYSSEHGRAME